MDVNWKKIRKTTFLVLGIIGFILGGLYLFLWYSVRKKYVPSENQYEYRIAYIDPQKSRLSDGFTICGERIVDYYNHIQGDENGHPASYSEGKNGLRKSIMDHYRNKGYTDSGYLNIRFVINCNGEAGRYVIHENDLDLRPKKFNPDLKEQLFELTVQLKKWTPVVFKGTAQNSYMYISYRIENGEITEIIP